MGPFLQKKCEKLSTGQKQRVNIARALVHDPQVIVFDEPTAGLDILSAQFILDVLRGERDKGKTVLFSTHILSEAEVLCDTIGLLHQGELLSIGTLEETIKKWDATTLTQAMLQATRGNTGEAHP